MNKLQAIAYIYRFHNMSIPRILKSQVNLMKPNIKKKQST